MNVCLFLFFSFIIYLWIVIIAVKFIAKKKLLKTAWEKQMLCWPLAIIIWFYIIFFLLAAMLAMLFSDD